MSTKTFMGPGDGAAQDAGGTAKGRLAPGRQRLLLALGASLLVAVVVALLLQLGGDRGDPVRSADSSAATTSSPEEATGSTVPPATTPRSEAAAPTTNADELPPALPAVALDSEAAVGNGVVVALAGLDPIQGTAVGPGNVVGPALRVTVRITNRTQADLSLSGVTVNLAYGPNDAPAAPLDDPSRRPFSTVLQPGEDADGIYVFSVPGGARETVTIEVGYQPGAPRLLFTGSAA